jgi:hypothetical protein
VRTAPSATMPCKIPVGASKHNPSGLPAMMTFGDPGIDGLHGSPNVDAPHSRPIRSPYLPEPDRGPRPCSLPLPKCLLTEHQSQKQQEQQNYRSVISAESLTQGAVGLTLPIKWSVVEENGGTGRTQLRPSPTASGTSTRTARGSAAKAARGSQQQEAAKTNSDRLDDRET